MIFEQLKPGDLFTLTSDTVYMKIDTVVDNQSYKIDTRGRWPYRDYNMINTSNGRMDTLVGGAEVKPVVKN